MTRCPEFYDKYEKEGNFCGLSPSAITQIKAYNEMREMIGKHIPDRAFVVENFPEYAARAISANAKDDETKTKAIDYVVHCLKRKEKVTNGDLKKTIHGWLKPKACAVEKKDDTVGHVDEKLTYVNSPSEEMAKLHTVNSEKVPDAPIAQTLKEKYGGQEQPVKKQAPCMSGKPCPSGTNYNKADANGKNRKCEKWKQFINQLPGDECWFDADERRKKREAAMGFTDALDMARPVAVNPYIIKPVQLTKEQAEEKLTEIVRGYLTPSAQRSWEFAKKAGLHENNLDLFQFFVDGIEVQDTDMAEEARA